MTKRIDSLHVEENIVVQHDKAVWHEGTFDPTLYASLAADNIFAGTNTFNEHILVKGEIQLDGGRNDTLLASTDRMMTIGDASHAGRDMYIDFGNSNQTIFDQSGNYTWRLKYHGTGNGVNNDISLLSTFSSYAGNGIRMSHDGKLKVIQNVGANVYEVWHSGNLTPNWILEDGDGTENTIGPQTEVKFVEGTGMDINWTGGIGSDGDPLDMTFTNTDRGSSQNIFKNVLSDSGTAVADNNNDTLSILGGGDVSTSVSGDAVTVSYTHPTSASGDIALNMTPLTGAAVVDDINITVTVDGDGHTTAASASVGTRDLTPGDIGAGDLDGVNEWIGSNSFISQIDVGNQTAPAVIKLLSTPDASPASATRIEFDLSDAQGGQLRWNTHDTNRAPFGLHIEKNSTNGQGANAYLDVEGEIYSAGNTVYHAGNFDPTDYAALSANNYFTGANRFAGPTTFNINGTGGSTTGGRAIDFYYTGSHALNTFGSSASTGATVIGFAVDPKTGTANAFTSSADNVSFARSAIILGGDSLLLKTSPSVAAPIGSDVSLSTVLNVGSTVFQYKTNDIWHEGNLDPSTFLQDGDADPNQNAFSIVNANGTALQADTPTDTVTINAGTGIAITADSGADSMTISSSLSEYSHPPYTPQTLDVSLDTSGAQVIDTLSLDVTSDTIGSVTLASGSVTTRNLTPTDIGAGDLDGTNSWEGINYFGGIDASQSYASSHISGLHRFQTHGTDVLNQPHDYIDHVGSLRVVGEYANAVIKGFPTGDSGSRPQILTMAGVDQTAGNRGSGAVQIGLLPEGAVGAVTDIEFAIRAAYNGSDSAFSDWYSVWHSGNVGTGSGLDADTVDGVHAADILHTLNMGPGSGFDADTVDGVEGANIARKVTAGINGSDYIKRVCLLHRISDVIAGSTAQYFIGNVLAYRSNAINAFPYIIIHSQDRYSDALPRSMITKLGNDAYNCQLGTCLYGGEKWMVLEWYAAASISSLTLEGTWNAEEAGTAINYYNDNTDTVLNSEINDSFEYYVEGDAPIKINEKIVWHEGSFDPSLYGPLAATNVWANSNSFDASITLNTANTGITNSAGSNMIRNSSTQDITVVGNSLGKTFIDSSVDPVVRISGGSEATIWHAGNDGSSSGLDADKLDSYEGSSFVRTVTTGDTDTLTIGTVSNSSVGITTKSNQANGLAKLDGNGLLPISLIPSSEKRYLGPWDASGNTLPPNPGAFAEYYTISQPGTLPLIVAADTDPISQVVSIGDEIIYGYDTGNVPPAPDVGEWYFKEITTLTTAANTYYEDTNVPLIPWSVDNVQAALDYSKNNLINKADLPGIVQLPSDIAMLSVDNTFLGSNIFSSTNTFSDVATFDSKIITNNAAARKSELDGNLTFADTAASNASGIRFVGTHGDDPIVAFGSWWDGSTNEITRAFSVGTGAAWYNGQLLLLRSEGDLEIGDTLHGTSLKLRSVSNSTYNLAGRIEFNTTDSQGVQIRHNTHDSNRSPFGLHIERSDSNTQTTNSAYLEAQGALYAGGNIRAGMAADASNSFIIAQGARSTTSNDIGVFRYENILAGYESTYDLTCTGDGVLTWSGGTVILGDTGVNMLEIGSQDGGNMQCGVMSFQTNDGGGNAGIRCNANFGGGTSIENGCAWEIEIVNDANNGDMIFFADPAIAGANETIGWAEIARFHSDTKALTMQGNITAYSDRRIKKDLEIIPDALDKVSRINGYTYTRKDTGERQSGVIAQEIQEVLPEVVTKMDSSKDADRSDHLAVSYGNMAGLFIEAIKELKEENDDLKSRLAKLEEVIYGT